MQNLFSFDQRRSNIQISVTDDRLKSESPLGPYYDEKATFLCGRRAEFKQFYEIRSHASRSCRLCPHALTSLLEGSKSTCVGDQRLPVRSTQPRVT